MLQNLQALFNRLREAGFLLKAKKCELFKEQVVYLGHVLCKEGLKMEKSKVNRILHWPEPNSVKELKRLARFRRILSKFHSKFRKMQSVLCITTQKPTIPVDGSVSHIIPEITESSNYRACFRNP